MVKASHTLEWASAQCELIWQSPNTYYKVEEIYIRLWGLIQTVNTTNAQYYQQLESCTDARRKAIITEHLDAKRRYYPQDDFPLIAFHPTNMSYYKLRLKQGEVIPLTIAFGGEYRHFAADWLQWFSVRLKLENTGFTLTNKPKLVTHKVALPSLTTRKVSQYEAAMDKAEEITLLIDMPANLTPGKSLQKRYEHHCAIDRFKYTLLEHSQKRLCQWFVAQQNLIEKWFEQWRALLLESPLCIYQLNPHHGIKTTSKSSRHDKENKKKLAPNKSSSIQYHQGYTGWLTLKGAWCIIPEFWQVLSSIHLLGQRRQINGLGYFLTNQQFNKPPPTLWQRHILKRQEIQKAVSEVLNRYELEPMLDESGRIMQEQALTDLLFNQLSTHTYQPQLTRAYRVNKPNGGQRQIEELAQLDMIVHRLVFNALTDIIDQSQSPLSVGYRKGYSRKIAKEKVDQLIHSGFNWIIEADIEAFFAEVPFQKLWHQLQRLLPAREKQTIDLIQMLMQTSFITSNRSDTKVLSHTREKGLMQGSPLSPVLANLYLSTLDQYIQADNLSFVRYADDILIFCRTEKDAITTLNDLEKWLSALGLTLSLDKSNVRKVSEGFEFLGYRFDKDDSEDKAIVPILRQRKPLMITGTRKYLGINGAALEIREKHHRSSQEISHKTSPITNRLVQLIPLRRISQLVIIGNHSLSSPLLSACAQANISVHVVNDWGFQIGTFTPNSADFYAISSKQYQRFKALKPSERLAIAADLVTAKINNYQTWISNSYRQKDALIIHKLEEITAQLSACTTVSQLLGYEGQAAKLCFQRLQKIMIKEQQAVFSSPRRSRGGVDRLNSLLNFGYYWLFTRISSLLHSHGLNPYLSYLHQPEQQYETLVYDLMELFRVYVDKTILRLINRKQIQARDFQLHSQKGWQLTHQALHLLSNQLQATFASKFNQTYLDDIILIQIRVIMQWATQETSLVWFYWQAGQNKNVFSLAEEQPQTVIIDHLSDKKS